MLNVNSDFLNGLSDKLQSANRTVLLEKKKEREEIEDRLSSLQKILAAKRKFEIEAIERARFSTDQLASLSTQTLKNFNIKIRKQEQLLRNAREKIENDLEYENREYEEKIEHIIENQSEKMAEILEVLSKRRKLCSQKNEKMLFELNKSITKLERDLNEEIQSRRENCMRIQDDISDEVSKFHNAIEKEEERREHSEQKLRGLMEEISEKITTDVQAQTNKRKKNNEAILKLIQAACLRLEQKIQG